MQHHMTGKQRVVTAVFSQHHHEEMVLYRFVLFNYHLQYFELCVLVDTLLVLSLTASHVCLCGLAVFACIRM